MPINREFRSPSAQERMQLLQNKNLVLIPEGRLFILENAYFKMGLRGTGPRMYFRQSLLARLSQWAPELDALNAYYLVFDAFRTLECQMELFDQFKREIKSRNPLWDEEMVEQEAAKFVAHPKYRAAYSALPHNTGAAIDLALCDRQTGLMWDFGTTFDDPTDFAATDFFEKAYSPEYADDISQERWNKIRDNRRILFNLMKESGFANYSREWWHYNLGDSSWALQLGESAPLFDSAEAEFLTLGQQS